ncbi:MAG: stalk domain-containing protein [Defluviitaleaceae bacterium]|nr:stalk domain-containing protein [Defluviitaleaceae bacterium]
MNEKRIKRVSGMKGFVVGVAVMFALSATVVAANPVMRELIFGVGVSFNGEIQDFDYDSRPFVIDGRTFLPVRAVADMVGLEIDFDVATNTVLLTTSHQQPGNRLADTTFHGTRLNENFVERTATEGSVQIVGTTHTNVTTYRISNNNNQLETHHNLGGAYSRLTGLFGRVDGAPGNREATVTILGDGTPIHSFVLGGGQMPVNLDVDVTGVQLLVVQVRAGGAGDPGSGQTLWAMSADLQ